MPIILNNSSMIPIYEQLISQIQSGIVNGSLKDGDPLPSVRNLAAELRISALTVKKAYDKLEEEGYIVTVHGKGSFVNAPDTGLAMEARRQAAEEKLAEAIDYVRSAGISKEEIYELISIILEDSSWSN